MTVGETVELGYVDQKRDALYEEKTAWEEISGGHGNARGGRPEDELARILPS